MVTTTEASVPSSASIGVALTSVVTLRPSAAVSTISSARTVSAAAQRACQRQPVERDLAPVGEAAGEGPEQVLGAVARRAQALDDAPGLAVERDRVAGAPVQHDDADRRGLDQRLEVGAGAPLGAVGARVGDRGGGLGGEQHQDLLVLVGERVRALLLDEIEVADMHAAMAHRRALEGLRRQPLRGEAELPHVGRDVGDADRPRQVAEVLEQPRALGPFRDGPVLLLGEARGDEVPRRARLVDGGDGAEAGAGERAGAVDHLVEHGLQVQARADAQARRAERGDARAQRLVFGRRRLAVGHRFLPAPAAGASPARAGTDSLADRGRGPSAPIRSDSRRVASTLQ